MNNLTSMQDIARAIRDLIRTATLIRDIVAGINAKFRELKKQGCIVDGTCWLDPESNSVETLKVGKLYIDYE